MALPTSTSSSSTPTSPPSSGPRACSMSTSPAAFRSSAGIRSWATPRSGAPPRSSRTNRLKPRPGPSPPQRRRYRETMASEKVDADPKIDADMVAACRANGKVRSHQTQNEALMFEKSSPGKRGYKMPPLDVPEVDPAALLGDAYRETSGLLPKIGRAHV